MAENYGGVRALYTSADEKPCPPNVKAIVDACRRMPADALALELADQSIVSALNVYDGTYAAAVCDPDVPVASVVRGLQVRLYSGKLVERPSAYLPAATVLRALGCWERQIGLLFGRRYAATLVASARGAKAPGELAPDDLENIRLALSSALGGCLLLQKVDK